MANVKTTAPALEDPEPNGGLVSSQPGLTPEQKALATLTDVKEILAAMVAALNDLRENMKTIAVGFRRLVELGVPRDEIYVTIPRIPYLEKAAFDEINPSLPFKFGAQRKLLNRLVLLPRPQQDEFAADTPVKIMELGGNFRMVTPSDLQSDQINQLFTGERLRTDSEQIQWLACRRQTEELEDIEGEPIRILAHEIVILRPIRLSEARLRALVREFDRKRRRSGDGPSAL